MNEAFSFLPYFFNLLCSLYKYKGSASRNKQSLYSSQNLSSDFDFNINTTGQFQFHQRIYSLATS
jgi:hypothetical protein